ncbi:MAG TPA: alpha/beta hydrolase [Solirubrobacterales bacterium]|nr:alpha/beta hydrolase [Solirubrobacterales bacterium]
MGEPLGASLTARQYWNRSRIRLAAIPRPPSWVRSPRGRQSDAIEQGRGEAEDRRRPRPPDQLHRSRLRAGADADPRHGRDLRQLGIGDRAAGDQPHRDRAGLPRPRLLGARRRRLLARRPGQRPARSDADARARAGELVGHSLGGGVAMQFTYQFPEMVERLVLVSSGGLGPDVSPILRAAALPGAELFISATAGVGSRVGSVVGRGLGLVGLRPNTDLAEVTRGYATLTDPDRRKAFVATLRSVVGTKGQRIAALDKLYLAEALPLLIVWGENDPIIPVEHARETHAQLPTSHLEIFEDTGHVPQLERPGRFIATLERFLAETEPAEFDRDEWRARFKAAEN